MNTILIILGAYFGLGVFLYILSFMVRDDSNMKRACEHLTELEIFAIMMFWLPLILFARRKNK